MKCDKKGQNKPSTNLTPNALLIKSQESLIVISMMMWGFYRDGKGKNLTLGPS